MTPEEARKLLGGYAAGTLTSEEKRGLYEAALRDGELFDELSRELSLKETLDDAEVRANLVRVLDRPAPRPWIRGWWLASASVAASLAIAAGLVQWIRREPVPSQVAMVTKRAETAPRLTPAEPRPVEQPKPAMKAPQVRESQLKAKPGAEAKIADAYESEAVSARPDVAAAEPQRAKPSEESRLARSQPPASAAPIVAQSAVTITVLRETNGEFEPAPSGTIFEPGDRVKLRVRSAAAGTVVLTQASGGRVLFTGAIRPEQALEIPIADSFGQGPVDLRLALRPGESAQSNFGYRDTAASRRLEKARETLEDARSEIVVPLRLNARPAPR